MDDNEEVKEEVKEELKQVIKEKNKKEESKEKEALYKKWWFWLIILLFIIIAININNTNVNKVNQTLDNNKNYFDDLKNNYEQNQRIKKNPYRISTDYDGIYKFSLNSDNGSGHIFISLGIISFDNGKCKIKYEYSRDNEQNKKIREYEGFCGLNIEDNSTFYFVLNDDDNYEVKTYKCTLNGKNLICELKSMYDLSGCTNKDLNLMYVEKSNNFEVILSQTLQEEKNKKEAEEKAKKEQEEKNFKASCQTYTFEQMARNSDNVKGKNIKVTGEVIQVMSDSYSTNLRVNITKNGTYSTYYTDTIYVVYYPKSGEDKILEDDIITIYGTSQGDCSYTTILGATVTLPNIKAEYITIENKEK